ncbi:MAG: hypothetical protein KF764_19935 [Labilithrix sp.]|nr:hypothetical protein [Labilithrix sp.]
MRARTATFVTIALAVVACVHEERRAPVGPEAASEARPEARSSSLGRQQYLVADPSPARAGVPALALGAPGVHGLVVDRRRIVVARAGEPLVAPDATSEPIAGASPLPSRFGGGFLFWTANALYRADAFDAKLVPLARVPDPIESIVFAPKAVVVRTRNGERWALRLPGGERAPIVPLGVADVQALDDGRAIALGDQGAVFTSTDHGARWIDATAQVKGTPAKVAIVAGDVWLFDSGSGASRLELDGRLSWFDRAPPDAAPELRPKDPRWRGSEYPLRVAFQAGAAVDESTAIVVDSGDVVRLDVHTGEVLSVVPGRLPPDAQCEAVPVAGDVLFACVARSAGGSAFVVSRTLASEPPSVEQTFVSGGQFYADGDGGLAYAGSCQGVPPSPTGVPVVCVRLPSGLWEEHDLAALSADAGAQDINVARWVPRSDGHVVAVVAEPNGGIYDPRSARFQPIAGEALALVGRGSTYPTHLAKGGRVIRHKRSAFGAAGIVDTSWSFGAGNTLRGWQRAGESFEISEDGRLTRSPYAFEVVFVGAMGLGRSKDGRLYQSADHGVSWAEVAAPPSGADAVDLVSCTSAGCDLGAFYRVGWSLRPPRVDAPKTLAPAAPEVRRVRALELSCRPRGAVGSTVQPRTNDSPEDLGLGAVRLPVANDRNDWGYLRSPIPRGIVSPIHEATNDSEATPSLRALLSGFGTSSDGDVITVTGPNKNAMALRRGLSYVPPFDPLGKIVRTSVAMSEVVAAGRRAGMTTDEILAEDFTESGVVVPITPSDPSAPSDIALHNVEHGLLSIARGERVRVAIRSSQNGASVISGAALPQDEIAFLEVEASGVGHVFKVGPGGAVDLFDVGAVGNEAYYPANPDALAVGPKGELAVLRTPSGSDPPSALDPAFVVVPSMPPVALAPWSELRLADDPACKAEPGGYRATLQTSAPWIRVTTPELRVEDAPMIARVRWTPKRVCLEGFEVAVPAATLRAPQGGGGYEQVTFATWLVARGGVFARVGVSEGIEWRQALDCSVVTPRP